MKLKDSKKLSAKQRETWFDFVKKERIPYVIAKVSPKIIDKINISNAANLAAAKAFKKLVIDYELTIDKCEVFLDGGLYLKESGARNKELGIKTKTIIRGDEKIPAISLASIVAKVYRDKLMKKFHKKYSQYDFIHNVGYGTRKHMKAIKKYGQSDIHRKSFKV